MYVLYDYGSSATGKATVQMALEDWLTRVQSLPRLKATHFRVVPTEAGATLLFPMTPPPYVEVDVVRGDGNFKVEGVSVGCQALIDHYLTNLSPMS